MTQDQRFVGIDVSSRRLDVHCHPDGESFAVATTPAGIARVLARLGQHGWIAACEATGGFESEPLIAINEAGRDIWCLHPADVRAFMRLTGRRAKTDALDARAIAPALEVAQATRKPTRRTKKQNDIKQSTPRRRHPLGTLSQLKSLRAAMTCHQAQSLLEARMAAARTDLASLAQILARLVAADPASAATARRIMSVPGAGKILAAEIIASMPELATIPAKQAASLAGVAPHPRQSGATTRPGRCQAGRANLRRCLHMAALSAIKARLGPLHPAASACATTANPPRSPSSPACASSSPSSTPYSGKTAPTTQPITPHNRQLLDPGVHSASLSPVIPTQVGIQSPGARPCIGLLDPGFHRGDGMEEGKKR